MGTVSSSTVVCVENYNTKDILAPHEEYFVSDSQKSAGSCVDRLWYPNLATNETFS